MSSLVETFGYLGVFLGVALEGEIVVLAATYLAREGLFSPLGIGLAAFAGSVATYQACFWTGRMRGRSVLANRPAWQARVAWLQRQIAQRPTPFILVYRVLFGLRAATPFALGISGVSPWRFSLVDIPVAAFWAAALVVGGWLLGRGVAVAVERFGATVMSVLAVIAVVALIVVIPRLIDRRGPTEP